VQPAPGGSAGDWLALSFADPEAQICGQVRSERVGDDAVRTLIAVFAGDEAIALAAPVSPAAALDDPLQAGPLTLARGADGRWSAGFSGEAGAGAFTLALEAAAEPLRFEPDGSEQPCHALGEVTVGGRPVAIDGPAQIGRGSSRPAVGSLERDLAAWLEDGVLIAVRATGPAGGEHDREHVVAQLADADAGAPEPVQEARLSTTYAADGRQRRAGLELWPHEDSDYPRRAAGETLCAATLIVEPGADAGAGPGLRWDIAFLDWRMEGRRGVGPYSLLRR
jgi:hypothetical protein